jgi:hypothetical protein
VQQGSARTRWRAPAPGPGLPADTLDTHVSEMYVVRDDDAKALSRDAHPSTSAHGHESLGRSAAAAQHTDTERRETGA